MPLRTHTTLSLSSVPLRPQRNGNTTFRDWSEWVFINEVCSSEWELDNNRNNISHCKYSYTSTHIYPISLPPLTKRTPSVHLINCSHIRQCKTSQARSKCAHTHTHTVFFLGHLPLGHTHMRESHGCVNPIHIISRLVLPVTMQVTDESLFFWSINLSALLQLQLSYHTYKNSLTTYAWPHYL